MKSVLVFFGLLLTLSSCTKTNPVETVRKFMRALERKDFTAMESYVTDNYRKIVSQTKDNYGNSATPKADEFTYTLVKNEEGFAEVNIEEKKHKDLPLKPYTIFYLRWDSGKWHIYSIDAIK